MTDWLAAFRRNRLLKLLSLLLAVALWLAVGSEERTETTLNLSLELVNLPDNLVVTSELPSALQVRVMGPRSVIRKLSQNRLTHALDLAGLKGGRHSFALRPTSFAFPSGAVVTRINPNPLNLTLTPTVTRTLPIKPVLESNLPRGYEVTDVRLKPDQVTVKGPLSEMANLKYLLTLPIDLGQVTSSTTVATDLDFKSLHLTLKEQTPILAELTVAPKQTTRTFTGVPITAAPQPARLQPSQVTVVLEGAWLKLKDLKPENLKVTVDTKNLRPGRHRLKVSVSLPPEIRLESVKPDTVTVKVGKAP